MSARTVREISALVAELSHDERHAIGLLIERVLVGRKVYGELVEGTDPRNYVHEALQEALDGSFYLAVATMRLERNALLCNPGANEPRVSGDPPGVVPLPDGDEPEAPDAFAVGTPAPNGTGGHGMLP